MHLAIQYHTQPRFRGLVCTCTWLAPCPVELSDEGAIVPTPALGFSIPIRAQPNRVLWPFFGHLTRCLGCIDCRHECPLFIVRFGHGHLAIRLACGFCLCSYGKPNKYVAFFRLDLWLLNWLTTCYSVAFDPSFAARTVPQAVSRDFPKPWCVAAPSARATILKRMQQHSAALGLCITECLCLSSCFKLALPNAVAAVCACLELPVCKLAMELLICMMGASPTSCAAKLGRCRRQPCSRWKVRSWRRGSGSRGVTADVVVPGF